MNKYDLLLKGRKKGKIRIEEFGFSFYRIDQLNIRIDNLHIQLSPAPPPPPSSIMKVSSPTITRTVDASSVTATNGFHHSSNRQVNNIKRRVMQTDLSIFVLIDEKMCRFFSILSIHTLNVAFFYEGQTRADSYFSSSTTTAHYTSICRCRSISVHRSFFSHCFN
jgi:hypothetical protein